MANSEFPSLFSKKNDGKIKIWVIKVQKINESKSNLITETGFVDGKITVFTVEITKGKNIGKANETTPYTQAISDAKSKWDKKVKEGYTTVVTGESHVLTQPMLAQDFNKFSKKIVFPAYIQRKLDGIRGIYETNRIHSRGGKLFPHLDHIIEDLQNNDIEYILDGELYSDKLTFEEISGLVRKVTLNENDKKNILKIQYRVYDIVNNRDYSDRLEQLNELFKKSKFKYVFQVETGVVKSVEEVKKLHDTYVNEGYEGAMIRNKKGGYTKKDRNYNLQKYKVFDDSEFEIIGFKDGVGKEKGAVIWTCKTNSGVQFDARPDGSIPERKKVFKDASNYIGMYVTVKHFGYTDDNTPRFPVAQLYPREPGY